MIVWPTRDRGLLSIVHHHECVDEIYRGYNADMPKNKINNFY